nr:serine/threonine protein kinase [Deltaproteobacteria bacterium]
MGGEDGNEANPPSTRVDILSTELTRHDGQEDLSDAALHEAIANRVRQRLFSGPYPGMEIGRYKLLEIIGEGGMGTVLRALDPQLHRQVALKVLQEQLSHQDEMRLRREAVAMAKLSHPNVVQVYEVGEADDRIFVAMELVSGQTLREWMQGEHSWRECVELFVQLGDGLAAAHECGLVHRDFKPGNALIDEKGRARVLDFGLARQTDADEGDESCGNMASTRPSLIADEAVATSIPLTKTGTVMGTPAYMSPEQFHGAAVDARSDQFSFCMTLYEALHGERPFGQGQLSEIMERIYRTQLSPVPAGHGVPRALRKILLRGMAAVPDSRWSSMDELLVELRALIAPRSHRWFTASLGVGLLVAGGGLVASLYGNADQRCEGSEQQLAGIWDPERRQMLEDAFDKTAAANAAATWT